MTNLNNNFVAIEDGISSFSNGKVTCKKTFNTMGIVWFIIGALMFVAQIFDKDNGSITMALLMMGLCAVAYGAIVLFAKQIRFYYNGKAMKLYKFMFNADRYVDVVRLCEAGEFSEMLDIPHNSAAKMMVEILVDSDYSVAYSQIWKFSVQNYKYEPSSEIREHGKAECQKINTLVVSY
jgi:hypothetical protein